MWYRKMATVRPAVWWLLLLVVAYIAVVELLRKFRLFDASTMLFIVQPILALGLAGVAYWVQGGRHDRIRHKGEKSLIIISVIAVWFVAYFLSGLVLTYVHNAVAMNPKTIVLNIFGFGVVAAAIEYVRYAIMQTGGRRNVLWLGAIVSLVFVFEQLSWSRLDNLSTSEDVLKVMIADVIPVVVMSYLLTYLAYSAGLWPQLAYRLGVLATVILPPIIPKYDWYLVGASTLLLSVAVYITIDRTRQDLPIQGRHYKHTARAYDIMFLIMLAVLVMFMIGMFAYKPLAIMSNSMKPVFSRGAMVIIQKAKAVDVREGDIVQYEGRGHMVTHRLKRIEQKADGSGDKFYITQGDNSPSEDEPVEARQIRGVVRAQVPYIGYPSVWLSELTSKKG